MALEIQKICSAITELMKSLLQIGVESEMKSLFLTLQVWLSGRWAQSSKQKPSRKEASIEKLIQKNSIEYEMSCLGLKGSFKRTEI